MRLTLLTTFCFLTGASASSLADDDDDKRKHRKDRDHSHYRGGEYKEKFRDGPCKIEREWKKNGEFKEERECKGIFEGPYYRRSGEYEEKFVDGPCKIEREWKKDGVYKEKQECKERSRHARRRPITVTQPPWIVVQSSRPVYRPEWEPSSVVAPPPPGDLFRCNRQLVGGVIGGIAGGALGNQIGKGDGRTAATIGGAIAGVLLGGSIGRSMDGQDQACIGHALEFGEAGRKVSWSDRETSARYVVTPGRIEQRGDGRYCRDYDTDIVIDGKLQKTRGAACRRPDGTWIRED